MQVFEMFAYVRLEDDPRGAPPAHPGTGWRERYSARQRIGGLVLAYARAAPQVQRIFLRETLKGSASVQAHSRIDFMGSLTLSCRLRLMGTALQSKHLLCYFFKSR